MTNIKEYTYYAEFNLIMYEYEENQDLKKFQLKLMDFQKRHKERAEPSYNLAVSFYEEGKIDKIDRIISNLIKFPIPESSMTMVDHQVYEYSIPYLYIEVKFKLGMFDQGIIELKKLIEKYPNDQKLLNIKYSICSNLDISCKKFEQKTLVIHTAKIDFIWTPILNKNNKISGSEYMAISMAKEFRDLGYRVFIFGSFLDIENKKDNQMMLEGIQYIDNYYFSDFCLEYSIDYLIISRQLENLVYYKNIKNVYLWVHDVLPQGDCRFIQIHKEKFKSVIAISEWQKSSMLKYTGIKEESIYVSRNAIHPKRFLKEIEKTPFRFIYTSDPIRGLDNFIEMIPWIKEKYPQSTFYIFGKKEQITDEILLFINENDYIYLSPRISQDQLSIELKKSDIWLYPCSFNETYCISAVEAMASGCLVASIKIAALTEIIHDRGIMVEK
jgi:glycosyltransferase involved in cell wall biosynthesis